MALAIRHSGMMKYYEMAVMLSRGTAGQPMVQLVTGGGGGPFKVARIYLEVYIGTRMCRSELC